MIIGVPKEIKNGENRVALTPRSVRELIKFDYQVCVELDAGKGSGISNEEFLKAGAYPLPQKDVWFEADMIVKVKEPLESEYKFLKENQIIFTFLHLASNPELAKVMLEKKVTGISYDTIQLNDGSLPILMPMSEIAGKLAVQIGAHLLEKTNGGKGILLGKVLGTKEGQVTIIGGGVAGASAVEIALGLGAKVVVLDINPEKLAFLDERFQIKRFKTLRSTPENITKVMKKTDLLIGAVLVTGAKAPKVVTRKMVSQMEKGSVVVDVAIDQGGCIETSRPTTHENPTYTEEGIIHYCVANIPGAVPQTSTLALTNATMPYILEMVNDIPYRGFLKTVADDSALRKGVNTYQGFITHIEVAEALGRKYVFLAELI